MRISNYFGQLQGIFLLHLLNPHRQELVLYAHTTMETHREHIRILITFPLRWINLPPWDWPFYLQKTKPAGSESRRAEDMGKHFPLVPPRAPHYNWATRMTSTSDCPTTTTPSHGLALNISQKSKCVSSVMAKKRKKSQFSIQVLENDTNECSKNLNDLTD